MKNIQRFKVLGMLGLPLAAIAVVAVLLGMNLGTSHKASADFPHAGVDFSIGIGAGCDSTAGPPACVEPILSPFKVDVKLNSNGGITMGGYDATVNYTAGLALVLDKPGPSALVQQGAGAWPPCGFPASSPSAGSIAAGCGMGISASAAAYTGNLMQVNFQCVGPLASAETLTLVGGSGNTQIADENTVNHGENANESITINCTPATATPLPTATSTPPPIPRVQKDCDGATAGVQTECNVFLLRQGAKIPPARCDDGTSLATLNEQINQAPVTFNPKGEAQDLAAFEFEVRFDPTKVCINLIPAAQWTDAGAVCSIRDKDSSTLEGIAQIGCVTIGKGVDTDGLALATIEVRPQPELFSQLRPNQDNGNVVQILNQGCELADEQGHAIPIFSCEDADITFRYLEGDVDGPDCDVDVFDTQQVAFRWGVNKGSLLYNSFLDLEPSGQVKGDGDIDIKDIQFVFGRFGSTCVAPWPAQLPVNPKA